MMQKPEALLKILSTNTVRNDGKWRHKDLYRQLYNPALYQFARQNQGSDGSFLRRIDSNRITPIISQLIAKLRNEQYQPQSLPSAKQRSVSDRFDPAIIADRLLQASIKLILEKIYEPIFSEDNHGARSRRNCHTALLHIRKKSRGMIWWITGELNQSSCSFNHHILIQLLQKKISDDRFLRLIRKFLNAGYLEEWYSPSRLTGRPRGGILSPILLNIYLHELDEWISAQSRENQQAYTRYLDTWIIGIRGSKEDAIQYQQKLNQFLNDQLQLHMTEEMELHHGRKGVPFLGYQLAYAKSQTNHAQEDPIYQLWMPKRKEFEFILEYGLGKLEAGQWKALAVKKLFWQDDQTIINWYNQAFRRFYDHYKLATNVSRLRSARWIWKLSWGKTMANKYRTQKAKIFAKYRIGKRIGVKQQGKQGEVITYLFDEPLRRQTGAY
jgi:retron-type reverse transcriptase